MSWRTIAALVVVAIVIAALAFEALVLQQRLQSAAPPVALESTAPAPEPAPAEEARQTQPAAPSSPGLPMGGPFIDPFNHLDTARWAVSDRPPTGAWQENAWRPDRLAPGSDGLVVTMSATEAGAAAPLASGEVFTRAAYRYGYFEVRWRVPRGPGVVAGAFTYAGRDGRALPQELDIEILGRDTRSAFLSYHVAGRSSQRIIALPFDAAEGSHTYAIEWSPRSVRWYIDDDMVWEADDDILTHISKPEQFMLNLWATDALYRWAGHVDPNAGPWQMTVQCVAQAREYPGHSLCPTR